MLRAGILSVLLMIAAAAPLAAKGRARYIRVVEIEITGLPQGVPIPDGAAPRVPSVYNADAVNRSVRTLSRILSENGYPYNKITSSISYKTETELTVRIIVDPDERVCAGQPVIIGVSGRRPGLFRRDARVAPGRPYNSADAEEAVRRLSMRPYVRSAHAASPVIVEDAPPCCYPHAIKTNKDAGKTDTVGVEVDECADDTLAVDESISAIDIDTSSVDKDISGVDNDTSAIDKSVSAVDKDTSSADRDASAVNKDTSSVDKDISAVDSDTAAVDKSVSAIDKDTSSADKDISAIDNDTSSIGKNTSGITLRPCSPPDSSASGDAPSDCDDPMRTAVVPITVVERRGLEIEGALGYESGRDGAGGRLGGRFDLSLVNLLRRGERADVSYYGAPVLQKFRLSASLPWVFRLPLEVGGAGWLEIEDGGYGVFSGELWVAAEAGGWWKCGAAARGSETVPPYDAADSPYRFYGADVFLELMRRPWERGLTVWEFEARTGSGHANRDRRYTRSRMELSAGVHLPVMKRWALVGRGGANALFTDEDYLPPAELYRVGGHGSLRGYSEDEFAFRTVIFSQIEALYYFNRHGSVYIFADGGAGFAMPGTLSRAAATEMIGYGFGLRFPSRLGTVSLEWARNVDEGWSIESLGRVHVWVRVTM